MAENGTQMSEETITLEKLTEKLTTLKFRALQYGLSEEELCDICYSGGDRKSWPIRRHGLVTSSLCLVLAAIIIGLVCGGYCTLDGLVQSVQASKCALENNFFVMEITRPVTDCIMCRGIDGALILTDVSREVFSKYAYSGRPILVRGATNNWTALEVFKFTFFKELYTNISNAFETLESECQFFPFRTDFLSLRDAFDMPADRADLKEGTQPWYIGWSNCHPEVAAVLRKHYSRPHFLPPDSESSAIDWIFMGSSGPGASLHLDYVHRPSWQAQISGKKIWHLIPPPECEDQCKPFNLEVQKGDIVFIDTNQWYHNTFIYPGEISITIGSEYD